MKGISTMQAAWAPKSHLTHLDPVKVATELEKIEERDGLVTATAVVERAKPKRSPLHAGFEWDNNRAAEEYRLNQARHLIRSVVIQEAHKEQRDPVRAYVVVTTDTERGYISTPRALSDDILRSQVLKRALLEAESWERRYQHLEELAGLIPVLRHAREVIATKSDAAQLESVAAS